MTERPPAGAAPAQARAEGTETARPSFGRAVLDAILEGHTVVVTFLAIVVAIVIGGLLIAFTDPPVLQAWNSLLAAPGNAVAQAWDAAAGAYSAMFEGAIFNPHTVSAALRGPVQHRRHRAVHRRRARRDMARLRG